jgi:hypothetical protein
VIHREFVGFRFKVSQSSQLRAPQNFDEMVGISIFTSSQYDPTSEPLVRDPFSDDRFSRLLVEGPRYPTETNEKERSLHPLIRPLTLIAWSAFNRAGAPTKVQSESWACTGPPLFPSLVRIDSRACRFSLCAHTQRRSVQHSTGGSIGAVERRPSFIQKEQSLVWPRSEMGGGASCPGSPEECQTRGDACGSTKFNLEIIRLFRKLDQRRA